MKVIKSGGHRLFENDRDTARVVSEMLIELERDGMDAVRRYSKRFDDWEPESFELDEARIASIVASLPEQVVRDTDYCQDNVRRFAQAQLRTMHPLEVEIRPGVTLGHKHIPMGSVGSYIPGGRYPLFGSAQMSIIPAKVAGVKTVVACTPPVRGEGCYPATINAMKKAGADRIFILGGVPALALMAFGLGDVGPVDMLVGAGNKFVAEAKRQLFGRCGIDLLAGPTEIAIIADDSADPALVACDLLGQAEHDPNSGILLICLSERFAHEAVAEVEKQLETLPTRDIAALSWRDNGIVTVAESPDEAVALSDDYAPEHLELHVKDTGYYTENLTNYGSLFVGEETTVAYGDKSIGTNHILPTSRAARYTGGVWVGKFLKTCTYQRMTPEASREVGEVTDRQCQLERMLAHAITARTRVERYAPRQPAREDRPAVGVVRDAAPRAMFRLDGKTALVTGAATGLGQAIAVALARSGADVAVSDLDTERLAETAALLAPLGRRVLTLAIDVRDPAQVKEGVASALAGLGKVDILVNNAGINRPARGLDVSVEQWDDHFATNVRGGFLMAQATAPGMMDRGWGRIIFIASQSGVIAVPGQPTYCATKGAVVQLVRALGVEWASRGITVNSVAPTFVETNMTSARLQNPEFRRFVLGKIPSGRLARPEHVAAATVYLASDEAAMVNGETHLVDGGWTAW